MDYGGSYTLGFDPIACLFANSTTDSSRFCGIDMIVIEGRSGLVVVPVLDGETVIVIDGIPPLVTGAVAKAVVVEPPITCIPEGVGDAANLLVFFLPTVPPTAPPITAPMITKATIMPMTILPFVDPQNDVLLLPSGGFSLRRSYELNDFPTGTTFPCSMPEPCENAGSAGGAAPGGVD